MAIMLLSKGSLGGDIKDIYHLCLVFWKINVNLVWLNGNLFLGLLKTH